MTEFNLSDKKSYSCFCKGRENWNLICYECNNHKSIFYAEKDVKEFISRLKVICLQSLDTRVFTEQGIRNRKTRLINNLNKLSGESLVDNSPSPTWKKDTPEENFVKSNFSKASGSKSKGCGKLIKVDLAWNEDAHWQCGQYYDALGKAMRCKSCQDDSQQRNKGSTPSRVNQVDSADTCICENGKRYERLKRKKVSPIQLIECRVCDKNFEVRK